MQHNTGAEVNGRPRVGIPAAERVADGSKDL